MFETMFRAMNRRDDFGVPDAESALRAIARVTGVPVRPKPELRGLSIEEFEAMRTYADVAASIEFRPAQLILGEIYAFLRKMDIPIYDNDQVWKWLDAKKPRDVKYWCWRPLRRKDVITNYLWGYARGEPNQSGYYNSDLWECRVHDAYVPLHALKKVEALVLRFGDEVKFFVSDFAKPNDDPFIMVRPALCDSGAGKKPYRIVFDMWDEPGFR